jgi:uncharacterized membrane protein
MSDANLMALRSKRESSYGVAPSGNWDIMRFVSESLAHEQGTTTSQEIRSDRQIADLVRNSIRAAGDLGIELSYGAYDELFEEAFFDTFSSAVTVTASTISFASADNSVNDSGSGFGSYTAGSWIEVSGTTSNDGVYKIVTAAAGKLTLSHGTVTNESAGASMTVEQGEEIVNGTTLMSRAFEKEFTDNTNDFSVLLGMAVNTFGLSMTPDSIVTGSFGFIGKSEASATSTAAGTPVAAAANEVMNAIDHVNAIFEAGGASTIVTEFGFDLNNNIRERLSIGQLGAVSLGSGTIDVTGTFRAYYENAALYNKLLSFANTSFALDMVGAAGNRYVWDFPRAKFSAGSRNATGINTDVIADMTFQAFRDPTENKSIRLVRFAA